MTQGFSEIIQDWVEQGATVLDLGCGNGDLLHGLGQSRQIQGYGIEKDPEMVVECLHKGINVLQLDLDEGLANFNKQSFDLVILKHTLQALHKPHLVIEELLRIGKKGIVTFPNFSHWFNRWYLAWKGEMPVSKNIPFSWYSTPNLHHCTCKDFEIFCDSHGIVIEQCVLFNQKKKRVSPYHPLRNLCTATALYLISSK